MGDWQTTTMNDYHEELNEQIPSQGIMVVFLFFGFWFMVASLLWNIGEWMWLHIQEDTKGMRKCVIDKWNSRV